MKKTIMLTCKDPGQFFRNCLACKHYEKCDYFNKAKNKRKKKEDRIEARKKKKWGQAPYCNHDYEFKESQFKDMKWWNIYKCRKCSKRLKVYNSNLRHERRTP